MLSGRYTLTCLLPDDLARALVFPEPEKHRLTQPIIPSPLRELHRTNHRRVNPNTTLHFADGQPWIQSATGCGQVGKMGKI